MKTDINGAQMRAARALLGWSRDVLAEKTGATTRTLARLEAGDNEPRRSTVDSICAALEAAGVEFIAENGGGPGVRLRKQAVEK